MKIGFKYGNRISRYDFKDGVKQMHATVVAGGPVDDDEFILDVYETDPAKLEEYQKEIMNNEEIYNKLYSEESFVQMHVYKSGFPQAKDELKQLFFTYSTLKDPSKTYDFEAFYERVEALYDSMVKDKTNS